MKTSFLKAVILSSLFSTIGFADVQSPHDARLFGSWELTNFVMISAQGQEENFCGGLNGKIIYEKSGYMSVSINCDVKETKKVPADDYGKMLFYAGSFEIVGDSVKHKITQSNSAGLIGKELIRKVAVLTESSLTLTGAFGNKGQTLRIEWKRVGVQPRTANQDSFAMLTYLKLKPGMQEKFMKEFEAIITPSRSEPGNIAWFVQQNKENPTEIVFYTRWVNQAALDFHLKSSPLANYIKNTAHMMAEKPRLVKFNPIDLK